jgi:transcriptional regulator with XRE-family HTH domain
VTHEAVLPPNPKGLGAYIRFQREQLHWKQATLSGMAGVSLSTIERVERGEPVRASSLEKIAVALELESDAFTRPRHELSEEEMVGHMTRCLAIFKDKIPACVAPFRTETQLRALAATHFAVLDTDVDDEKAHDDLAGLREWIDLTAFMKGQQNGDFKARPDRGYRARQLYRDVFEHVEVIERRHNAVCLVGTYEAACEDPDYGSVPIGLLTLRSKARNPAAALLDQVWVEKTMSLRAAWQRFLDDEP